MKEILIVIGLVILCTLALVLFYKITLVPTQKFYDDCDLLEKEIKLKNDKDNQIKKLIELDKFSWHRTTGSRIR